MNKFAEWMNQTATGWDDLVSPKRRRRREQHDAVMLAWFAEYKKSRNNDT